MSLAYPWQMPSWERAWSALHRGAHALLIAGAQGLGKGQFADALAAARLCHRRDDEGYACGHCESCHWLAVGTHPDLCVLEPIVDEDADGVRSAASPARSKPISVDQIRGMTETLGLTAHREAGKVVIVRPADALNVAASNALLKSLEEPPPGMLFLLVSDRPALLLPTVRSRCQRIAVAAAAPEAALPWLVEQGLRDPESRLRFAGRAPLAAVEEDGEPAAAREALLAALARPGADALELADACQSAAPDAVVGWLQKWTYDLVAARTGGAIRYNVRQESAVRAIARGLPRAALLRFERSLSAARAVALHPLNARLFVEEICLRYAQLRESPHE